MTTMHVLERTSPMQVEETFSFSSMSHAASAVLEKISSIRPYRSDILVATLEDTHIVNVKQEPASARALAENAIEIESNSLVAENAPSALMSLAAGVLEVADAVFTAIKEKYDSVSTPISIVKTSMDWAALIPSLENLAGVVNKSIGQVTAPLKLIKLIDKLKKAHKKLFETPVEGAEPTKCTEIASLGYSLFSSVWDVISWLQKIGIITPTIALAARISILTTIYDLMTAVIDLGDNVQNFTTSANLAKAILKFTSSAIKVILIGYTVANVKILLLTLSTGSLILNLAVSDEQQQWLLQVG